jgi:TRAP-type uncharacterized transport system fused permease subunit
LGANWLADSGYWWFIEIIFAVRKVVLGARIPTTPSYIIAVTVRAYAPGKLGVPLLAADMFIFYYPVLCDLSTLGRHHRLCRREHAGSEMMSTGIEAFELGMAGFLIPSAFAEIRPKFRFKIQFACSTILVFHFPGQNLFKTQALAFWS